MANEKMENLKDVKQDSMLDEKDMDQVAGGYREESLDDHEHLLTEIHLNHLDSIIRSQPELKNFTKKSVETLWAMVGIEAKVTTSFMEKNTYFYEGKQITRSEAKAHAVSFLREKRFPRPVI